MVRVGTTYSPNASTAARYADLRVADVSLIPGQDDRSSRAAVEALGEYVVPTLTTAGLLG